VSEAFKDVPGALVKIGCALMGSGEGGKAVALVDRLLADRPDDPELVSAARLILSHQVAGWHAAMLADAPRNQAFAAAIERAVAARPGCTVLDIGTGSGLLAMIAARAGAGRVVACEAHPALAETARAIVERNGFADRITVIAKHSTDLDRERDLGGGADIIVAEVFSEGLLNEGALATFRHAVTALGRPGVQLIPAAATVQVALAERPLHPLSLVVLDFDLSPFERHFEPERKLSVADSKLRLRSEPDSLFTFDFTDPKPAFHGRARLTLPATGGGADGVVRWIRLELDAATRYENRPGPDADSHWAAVFQPFPAARALGNAAVTIEAAYNDERIQLWFPEA
jgi:predicted RNA methylase